MGFPGGSDGKESAHNVGDLGSIPGSARSPKGTPVFLPGESHGPRSPVDYSPWVHKESDTTERLTPYRSGAFPFAYASSAQSMQSAVCLCRSCFHFLPSDWATTPDVFKNYIMIIALNP